MDHIDEDGIGSQICIPSPETIITFTVSILTMRAHRTSKHTFIPKYL